MLFFPIEYRSVNIYFNKTLKIVVWDVTFCFFDNLDVTALKSSRKPRVAGCVRIWFNFKFYTLSGRTGSAMVWYSKGRRFAPPQCSKSCDLLPSPHCSLHTWSSGGTALCRVGGATSQLDLPSLTPLSVAVVVDCN